MSTHTPRSSRRRIWPWILGVFAASFVVLAICIINLVTLTHDGAALRREILAAGELRPSLCVQASVGPLLLGAVRGGLHFVPDVPAEAHHALAAVRRASVGVYQLAERPDEAARGALLEAADALMLRRGWVRTVGVRDGDETVMIFTPANASDDGPMRVCVAVCSDRELVVVDATVESEGLGDIVAMHAPKLVSR